MSVVEESGVLPGAEGGGTRRWFSVVLDDGPGGPESAGDRVVRLLGRGAWPGVVAAAAGVDAGTLRATLREGAVLSARVVVAEEAEGRGLVPGVEGWPLGEGEWPLTGEEWQVVEFSRAVAAAKARDELERGESIRRVASGEVTRTVTTTKYAVEVEEGVERRVPVEVVERVEEIPPDPDAQIKVMERLYPERWRPTDRSQVDVAVSGQVTHRVVDAREVVASAREKILAARSKLGIDAGGDPIEVTASETDPVEADAG